MRNFPRLAILSGLVLTTGCGSGLRVPTLTLQLTPVSGVAHTWPKYCKELSFTGGGATEDATITLTAPAGAAWYADAACATPVTSVVLAAGATSAAVFFRADAVGTSAVGVSAGAQSATLNIETKAPTPDFAVGQADLNGVGSNQGATVAANTLSQPGNLSDAGNRVAVSDMLNNRVLIYQPHPSASDAKATVAVGQATLDADACNNGAKDPTASTLCLPQSAVLADDKLIVTDQGNNRVLIWSSIPTVSGTAADIVLGQPDMTSDAPDNGGVSAKSMDSPRSAASDGKALVVADFANYRVLIWNTFPTASDTPADVVLGQLLLTDSNPPPVTPTASSIEGPLFVRLDYGKLIVSDCCDNRVMIWNSLPTTNNAPADLVLGQADMASATTGTGLAEMTGPGEAVWTGRHFIVADTGNNRTLFWNGFPTTGAAAAFAIDGMPLGIAASPTAFWITEDLNHRVLRFARP